TLPANLAVVANPELAYVAIPHEGEYLVVAEGLAESFVGAVGIPSAPDAWVKLSADGLRALEGTRYQPPFPRTTPEDHDYRLWFARHATLEAGTGLVHTAPGHGADDYLVGRAQGLQIYAPVDGRGRFTEEAGEWSGEAVFDANPKIVEDLH